MLVLVSPRPFDLEAMERTFERDEGPRHGYRIVAEQVGARHVSPQDWSTPGPAPRWARVLARCYGTAELWVAGRYLARSTSPSDVLVFSGVAEALTYWLQRPWRRRGSTIVLSNIEPKRFDAVVLRVFRHRLAGVLVTMPTDDPIAVSLPALARVPQVGYLGVDTDFYSPDQAVDAVESGLVAAAGLVDRDYRLVANALDGLDARLEICAAASVPGPTDRNTMPDNPRVETQMTAMSLRELRDLYRRAEIVVVPLVTGSQGGLTVVSEALSCGKAVVATTANEAVRSLAVRGVVVGVPPGDGAALRSAIRSLRADPVRRAALETGARAWALEHASNQVSARHLVDLVSTVAPGAIRRGDERPR